MHNVAVLTKGRNLVPNKEQLLVTNVRPDVPVDIVRVSANQSTQVRLRWSMTHRMQSIGCTTYRCRKNFVGSPSEAFFGI